MMLMCLIQRHGQRQQMTAKLRQQTHKKQGRNRCGVPVSATKFYDPIYLLWECRFCTLLHNGDTAPQSCPNSQIPRAKPGFVPINSRELSVEMLSETKASTMHQLCMTKDSKQLL